MPTGRKFENLPDGRKSKNSMFEICDGWRSHSLDDFFAAQNVFGSLKKAPKQTLCSLPTSDMLDIANKSIISGASVADTRKW